MAPGRRAELASATDAEVRVGAFVDDEAASGQEVARNPPGLYGDGREHQHRRGHRHHESSCHECESEFANYSCSLVHCFFSFCIKAALRGAKKYPLSQTQ